MEYKQFFVNAFEREPRKWRARIHRTDGRAAVIVIGRKKFFKFITGIDAATAEAALQIAMAAIDAGAFSRVGRVGEQAAQTRAVIRERPNEMANELR